MKTFTRIFAAVLSAALTVGCGGSSTSVEGEFSQREKAIISHSSGVMYVLDAHDKADESILRIPSEDLSDSALKSDEFKALRSMMLETVQSPQQGGVGIAAPQVGISKKLIAVCRMDKEGEPFEVYPNISIVDYRGEQVPGPEGCLSVPDYRGMVNRYQAITIEYTDPETLQKVTEDIEGYTAVIFQHECDHLLGILYVDKADTVFENDSWKEERKEYKDAGLYDKPQWLSELINIDL